jgi:hypothetical protein
MSQELSSLDTVGYKCSKHKPLCSIYIYAVHKSKLSLGVRTLVLQCYKL